MDDRLARHFQPPPPLDLTETDDRFTNDLAAAKAAIAARLAVLANRASVRMQGPYNWATEPDQEWT